MNFTKTKNNSELYLLVVFFYFRLVMLPWNTLQTRKCTEGIESYVKIADK